MFCSNCGHPLAENANFCNKCGLKATQNEPVQPDSLAVNSAKAPVVQQVKSRSNGFSVLIYSFLALTAVVLLVVVLKPTPRKDICDCFDTVKILFDGGGDTITSVREAERVRNRIDKQCAWIAEEMTPDEAWLRFLQCK